MLAESFFHQGDGHEVCEDYAVHGDGYIFVSDGCSNAGGGSIDSDVGARIMCLQSKRHVPYLTNGDYAGFFHALHMFSAAAGNVMNAHWDCLTATLLSVFNCGEKTRTLVCGDGVVGGKSKARPGEWVVHQYEFLPGGTTGKAAPFYFKYIMHKEVENYLSLFGGKLKKTTYRGDLLAADRKMEVEESEHQITPDSFYFVDEFAECEFVFACTDGVGAFQKEIRTETSKHKEPVPILDVLGVLLDVPPLRSGFLRAQRAWAFRRHLRGTFPHRGWHPDDDVSCGIVRCGA